MSEHHNLQTVPRHVICHLVSFDHVMSEIFAVTLDRQRPTRIPSQAIKRRRRILTEPRDKKLSDLMIINGIGIRWIRDENIEFTTQFRRRLRDYFSFQSDRARASKKPISHGPSSPKLSEHHNSTKYSTLGSKKDY